MKSLPVGTVIVRPGELIDDVVQEHRYQTGYGGGMFIKLLPYDDRPPQHHNQCARLRLNAA